MKIVNKGRVLLCVFLILLCLPLVVQVTPVSAQVNEITLPRSTEPRQISLTENDSVFGVCYLPPYSQSQTLDRALAWRRIDTLWDDIQENETTWDWSRYDSDTNASEASNLFQIVLLVYGNENLPGGQPKFVPSSQLDYWEEFVRNLVQRYKDYDSIIAYEVWNEANIDSFWTGDMRDYAKLLARTCKAIREEDPDALILGSGTASSVQAKLGPNEVFYEQLFKWNQSDPEFQGKLDFDVVAVHAYLNNPVQYRELIQRQKDLCDKYNFDWSPNPNSTRFQDKFSKIWVTEIGFGGNSSIPRELNRQQQQTIKAATIGYFENLGRHLIYQWKWDETWVIEGKPVMDAIDTIFPIWKNSTPFESFSHINDHLYKTNTFNLYAAETWDGKIAIGYWDEQTEGTSFDVVINTRTTSIDKIWLPNFSWEYTDFEFQEGDAFNQTRIKNLIVENDFQMLLITPDEKIDSIKIIVELTPDIVMIYYILPVLMAFSVVITGLNLIKNRKKVKERELK
ncbi:MAG: cellulase family glycosylhydrolase [Candidatus Hodarchaeota archaeon]